MSLARWLQHLPSYVWNGAAVAVGIGVVQLLFGAVAGLHAAQMAASGAVCTSLADVPNTSDRTWQRVLAAAGLSVAAALVVALLQPFPAALGLGVAAVAFVAMMTTSWGTRALPVSFAPLLSMVFVMAVPASAHQGLPLVMWNGLGALAYAVWSVLSLALLQPRYRRLALAATLGATAKLFRSRAAVLQAPHAVEADTRSMRAWIDDERALAERLQSARDLLFAAPDTSLSRRDTAVLLRAIDLRDVLLASRLDLDLLGDDAAGRLMVNRVSEALRQLASALEAAVDALLEGQPAAAPAQPAFDFHALFADVELDAADRRIRLLPAVTNRLKNLSDHVAGIHALLRGGHEELPLSRPQLRLFVAPEGWPLAAVAQQLSLRSPVLRHAVRMALALASAYYIALALPWASHPHWLVLSVAVVLRGNLEQTLSRRNARVFGTVLGCLLVVLLGRLSSLQNMVFLAAAGVAHAFVNVRYIVTASAATVMALLQSHMVDPSGGFAITERLADTLLGALLAWGFSYVLPSWERRHLPQAMVRSLQALQAYARQALATNALDVAAGVQQRLARRQAYDGLAAVAASLQRSAVEPQHVRLPVKDLNAFLDHSQRLMAHLSVIRLMLARRSAELDVEETPRLLRDAGTRLWTGLDPNLRSTPADGGTLSSDGLDSLPPQPPQEAPMPWLRRRLEATVREAQQARASAASALAALDGDAAVRAPSAS